VFLVDVFALENLVDFMQCVFHGDFMRKVGSEHASLRSNAFNDIGECAFVSLTADEKPIASKIVDDRLFAAKLAILALALHPIDHQWDPTRTALEKTDS
jgi:hypothetical protein